ncbi:MAG: hypothetical protein QNJ05_07890 [Woeseiaceae bacterium]|nr:hypothetical protein [Woeseiaceae bacterium]
MGNWGHRLDESDTFADVYDAFFDEYNSGASPEAATAFVRSGLADYFEDDDDQFDAHFALAFAQWETKSLESELLDKVAHFIESGADLANWEDRDADPDTLKKRSSALSAFLKKLKTARKSKKRRVKPKFDFRRDKLIELPAPDGRKVLTVEEHYARGAYSTTVGYLQWAEGGSGTSFCYDAQGVRITARWIDSQNLEITVEKGLEFEKRDDWTFFFGDKVGIQYKEV